MEAKLTFTYDREGDILYINKIKPYREQESEEIDEGIIARFNPKTSEIENLEILFFLQRLHEENGLELPIAINLRLNDRTPIQQQVPS